MTPEEKCLMCIPEYRKNHVENDSVQDKRLNALEKKFLWIVVAAFIGSTSGSFASNVVTRSTLVMGQISDFFFG